MPRQRRRFSKLIASLRDGNGTATAGRVGEFKKWLVGEKKINVTRRPDAAQMERFTVGVLPFSVSPAATPTPADYFLTSMTVQAWNIKGLLSGISDNEWGMDATANGATENDNFYSAYMRVALYPGDVTESQTETSGITGDSYKTKVGRSGSIPFGRTVTSVTDEKTKATETSVADADQQDVASSLIKQIRAATITGWKLKTVSFVPETWQIAKSKGKSKPSDTGALQGL